MDLNEKRKLMVSANLTLEQPTSNMGRVIFPMKAPLTINKDVGIVFDVSEHKFILEVACGFEYWVGSKRYDIFSQFDGQSEDAINLMAPENGSILSFVNENIDEWIGRPMRVLQLVRWIYDSGLYGSHVKYNFKWTVSNGRNWNPFNTIQTSPSEQRLIAINLNAAKLREVVNSPDLEEPLHFTLLREAQANLTVSPKSSLLLLVVALEIAAKSFLVKLDTGLEDLFNGANSPKLEDVIFKLLQEYNPNIIFTHNTISDLRNLIRERNFLVHRGEFKVNEQTLNRRFLLVKDILYVFDFFSGMTLFGQEFYQHEKRLTNQYFSKIEPADNIGNIILVAHQATTFEKRGTN